MFSVVSGVVLHSAVVEAFAVSFLSPVEWQVLREPKFFVRFSVCACNYDFEAVTRKFLEEVSYSLCLRAERKSMPPPLLVISAYSRP